MKLAAALAAAACAVSAAAAADRPVRDVAQVYCLTCHGSAAMNAPRAGDPKAWSAFAAKHGELGASDIAQVRKVPVHAGIAPVTDGELAAAIRYLMQPSKDKP